MLPFAVQACSLLSMQICACVRTLQTRNDPLAASALQAISGLRSFKVDCFLLQDCCGCLDACSGSPGPALFRTFLHLTEEFCTCRSELRLAAVGQHVRVCLLSNHGTTYTIAASAVLAQLMLAVLRWVVLLCFSLPLHASS